MIKNLLYTATLMGFIAFINTNVCAEACEEYQACASDSVVEKSNEDCEDNQACTDNFEYKYEGVKKFGFEMLPLIMEISDDLKPMMDCVRKCFSTFDSKECFEWCTSNQVEISESDCFDFDELDSDILSDIKHEKLDDANSEATKKSSHDANSDATHKSSHVEKSKATHEPSHDANSDLTPEKKHSNSPKHSQENHTIQTRSSDKAQT